MNKLPFTDCIHIVGTAVKKFDGTKKYISTGALDCDHIDGSQVEEVSYDSRPSRANLTAHAGDILFAKMQGTKKTLVLDKETEKHIYSTGFCAVRPKTDVITSRCLYHLISSADFLFQKDKNCSGATQKAITYSGLQKIVISIPDIAKQPKIAECLDLIDHAATICHYILELLDQVVKSRFVEMFGNVSQKQQLKDFSTLITKGASPKWQGIDYCNEGVLFITSENVRKGFLDLSKKKYLPHKINEILPRSVLHRNDILVNIVNASIGRAAIFDSDELANINQAVALVRVDPKKINTIFLLTFLNSEEARRTYDFMKVGGDKSNLSLKNISELMIPVVSIAQQEDFAAFVRKIDKSKFVKRKW